MSSGVTADTRVLASILTLYLFVPPILSLSIKSRRVLCPGYFISVAEDLVLPELLWMLYIRDTPLVGVPNITSIYQLSSP